VPPILAFPDGAPPLPPFAVGAPTSSDNIAVADPVPADAGCGPANLPCMERPR